MLISKIELSNWKNFQHSEVDFSERSFIVGANASGKSNMLDALRFLHDLVRQGGGLQSAVAIRGGITKIRCLAARTNNNVAMTVYVKDSITDVSAKWKYHLCFKHTGGGINKSEVTIVSESVSKPVDNDKVILDRTEQSEGEDSETLKYTHLQQPNANGQFRELKDFFQTIEYMNVVPQLVREPATISLTADKEDYFGRNFLERISKLNQRVRDSYFRRINDVLKIAVPQLEELSFVKDNMGVPHLEARYKHWRAKGSKQQESQFSDGTLRLIGFLFALLDCKGVILLEEPEINLHSAIVGQIPEFISKLQRSKKELSQVIITTHSYDILSNQGIGSHELVVLTPTHEGTEVNNGALMDEVKRLLGVGLSPADAVMNRTSPENSEGINQIIL